MTAGALLVVGEVVTDVVARYEGPLAPGTDTGARIAFRPGGAGANVAAWAAAAGADARLLARAGTDCADWHRAELAAAGVGAHLVVDPDAPTAVVISLVDPDAERTLVTDGGTAVRLGPEDWDDALLDGVARLHLSGYHLFGEPGRRLAAAALAAARAAGAATSADPASAGFLARAGTAVVRGVLDGVGLLLPNLDEARLLAGTDDPVAAAELLSARHGEAVVTLGAAGALVAVGGRLLARVPGVPAEAVDSTGAGDAFTGGLLAARLAGADPVEAAGAGCRSGAAAVAVVGARPPAAGRPGSSPGGAGSPPGGRPAVR